MEAHTLVLIFYINEWFSLGLEFKRGSKQGQRLRQSPEMLAVPVNKFFLVLRSRISPVLRKLLIAWPCNGEISFPTGCIKLTGSRDKGAIVCFGNFHFDQAVTASAAVSITRCTAAAAGVFVLQLLCEVTVVAGLCYGAVPLL